MLKNQPNYVKQNKTRTQFKDALVRLLMTKDFMTITITDICKEADLSRGAFYTYYSSADALLREMEDEVLESFLKEVAFMDDPGFLLQTNENKMKIIKKYLDYSYTIKDKLKVFLSGNCGVYFSNKLVNFYKKKYRDVSLANGKADDVKINFCVGGVFNVIREWSMNDIGSSSDNIEQLSRTIGFILETQLSLLS